MINVTQTFLPPQEEYNAILKKAWDAKWITNRGQLLVELEGQLKNFLEVPFLSLTTNGTLPLQIAIKALGLTGEIITTPFSYVATTSSIVWENCKPVFVDIDAEHLTIDETKIEEAVTPKTTAILATHVFGNPCHIEAIENIAKKHDLKVIYDAAHCFGVKYKGKSIFSYGDVSTCSFHATKIFHTGEGGCWTTNNKDLQHSLYHHHNFGHNGPVDFYGLGINAKMSELQAAMGLTIFPYMDEIFEKRKNVVEYYNQNIDFSELKKMELRDSVSWNYSYYPLIFKTEEALLQVQRTLNQSDIFPRRYFYPSLNKLNYVEGQKMPVSESIAKRILCLPLYVGLKESELRLITNLINT